MRGVITKVDPTHYEVRCDAINETVILSAFDVRPMNMNKNLREQLSNSNGDWAQGSHIDF